MAFSLGNFTVDEIITGVAQDFDDNILYTLDQLSSANIEISSDSTDITDKRGNVVRTIYKTKTGTFTATNAFLHPQVMNAQSGSKINIATADNALVFPKIMQYAAGATVDISKDNADMDTVKVIGVYGNGGNSVALTQGTKDAVTFDASKGTGTYGLDTAGKKIVLPPAASGAPISYVIKFDRTVTAGYKLTNEANKFAATCHLTLSCAIVDPCSDKLRSAYVYIPSFQASPETTINFDADDQELEFTGNLQTDYCAAEKTLYVIYFPDEDAVTTAIAA